MSGVGQLHSADFVGRRAFLKGGASTVAGTLLFAGKARGQGAERSFGPVVETAHGAIRGFVTESIHSFRGVPYGASTAGRNRFRPPEPPRSWSGVLNTLGWGATAPQGDSTTDRSFADNPYALAEGDVGLQTFESEDCLALNVWTPSVNDDARRPVMLWLHGGGFWSGSASTAVHDGGRLSRFGDVVVVSCNHRLNVLGFTPIDSPGFEGSGNVGMLDILLVLQWIQNNIARFGGDPKNVTIFGYSGGGQKVSALMAMPQARGLFHKAIVQSGQTPALLTAAQGEDVTRRLCSVLGVGPGDGAALQALPVDALLSAYRAVIAQPPRQLWGFPVRFSPVVDGQIIAGQPLEPSTLALSAHVPLMIGSARQEMAAVTLSGNPEAHHMRFEDLPERLAGYVGKDPTAVIAGYRTIYPEMSPWDLFAVMTADIPTRINSIRIAQRRHAARSAPVFMYRTDWQTPGFNSLMKAPHGLEVPLVFRNVQEGSGVNGGGEDAKALSERLSSAWVAFARSGTPSTPSLEWPAYEPTRRATMLFDRECRIAHDPDGEARRLLDQLRIGQAL
ncbi:MULTISPECIES: carboxylesterase/lipase family protein [unclassified Sphingobium]|uniref:carboxylesterase/lipase family protein n=1 Tax=unclassified Sphingobium TaxID=2611147 RepID=UPI0022249A53|nr:MULTISPECIES: carboxylesterase family protein [unclassified Sphingobium]MCW2393790.1 para-nitrobenzyl esterase [Sphingobium sp. B8D3B]MCW2417304.1 para-nitrobenzyl esterase [Sphingobium sp. B8D3C]